MVCMAFELFVRTKYICCSVFKVHLKLVFKFSLLPSLKDKYYNIIFTYHRQHFFKTFFKLFYFTFYLLFFYITSTLEFQSISDIYNILFFIHTIFKISTKK